MGEGLAIDQKFDNRLRSALDPQSSRLAANRQALLTLLAALHLEPWMPPCLSLKALV